MTKKLFPSKNQSNELSRLLTAERLESAKVNTSGCAAESHDDDLKAIYDRVRSSANARPAKPKGVSKKMLRKLAGL